MYSKAVRLIFGLFLAICTVTNAQAITLNNGDILVASSGAIWWIDPVTGDRTVVSGGTVGTGPSLSNLKGITLDQNGDILGANIATESLIRIDPATGNRTVVSGCSDSACSSLIGGGLPFINPTDVRIGLDGRILVMDELASNGSTLFVVDPVTGDRTIHSSNTVGSGPGAPIGTGFGIASTILSNNNDVFVFSRQFFALLSVSPLNGDRTYLSMSSEIVGPSGVVGDGANFGSTIALDLEDNGNFLVLTRGGGGSLAFDPVIGVIRVDPGSGDRTLVSGCNSTRTNPITCLSFVGGGTMFQVAEGMARESSGSIIVSDIGLGILRVSPVNGDRTIISPNGSSSFGGPVAIVMDLGSSPEADAGPDQSVPEGTFVTLDGSGSTGDGDPLTDYQWMQIAGPPVIGFDDVTDPMHPTFISPTVPVGGATVTFELIVGDGVDFSDADTVDITITNVNNIPVADAGDPGSFPEGTVVTLDGSNSFDLDSEPLTCTWTQTGDQSVTIDDPNACVTTFTAPLFVPVAGEVLTFQLIVNDGLDSSAPDTVDIEITHINQAPTANAGGPGPLTRDEGATVTLDGSGSSDPDSDPLTFLWEQTSGPVVIITNDTFSAATFGAPAVMPGGQDFEFKLTVDDGEFSDMDTVIIHVQSINDPPNCALAVASLDRLWPPNHKMHEVDIDNLVDQDNDSIEVMITSVFQDEPVNGLGDGDTSPDAIIQMGNAMTDNVLLRAERAGPDNGRVYHIEFSAFDGFEGCDGEIVVTVPHSRKGKPAGDDGALYDSTLP